VIENAMLAYALTVAIAAVVLFVARFGS